MRGPVLQALAASFYLVVSCLPVEAQTTPARTATNLDLDFRQSLAYALDHSPAIQKATLELTLRRLDEADARHKYFPDLSVGTTYLVNKPGSTDERLSLSFSSSAINPLRAHFGHRAAHQVIEMAMLIHLDGISKGVHQMASGFLDMEYARQLRALQVEWTQLIDASLALATNRANAGQASVIDVAAVAMQRRAASIEAAKLDVAERSGLLTMRNLMGIPPHQSVRFRTDRAPEQILCGPAPESWPPNHVYTNSLDFQILQYSLRLQDMAIVSAYGRYMPNLRIGLQNPDALYATDSERDLYFYVGLDLPLWDGRERAHNVSRQKTILQQMSIDATSKEANFLAEWQAAIDNAHIAELEDQFARDAERLERRRLDLAEERFAAGMSRISDLSDAREDWLEAKRTSLDRRVRTHKARLKLYLMAGVLRDCFVTAKLTQEEETDHASPR